MSETVKTESTTKKSFFKRVKSEFKKVTWPKKEDLIKQTALVVVISVILGVVISLVDTGIAFGFEKILGIG